MADDETVVPKVTPPAPAAETPQTQEYFFPAAGKTIRAATREEAESKLTDLLKKDSKN